ncbi:MAG: hypothetical protein K8T20_01515 [Planctomycetes bacterium]|nr:hypothetical protein [Planctomycetota bacterium]
MPDDLVTLECPKCRAGLDIYSDTESLVCHQCALPIVVKRTGGSITMNGSSTHVMEISRWPGLIAAESEVAKVEDSIARLRAKERELASHFARWRFKKGLNVVGVGLMTALAGAWIARGKDPASQTAMAVFVVALFFVALMGHYGRMWVRTGIWRPYESDPRAELNSVRGQIASLRKQLLEMNRQDTGGRSKS